MTMETPTPFSGDTGRRNLLAALGSLALFSFLARKMRVKGDTPGAPVTRQGQTDCGPGSRNIARMLTQDGRLVEIDLNKGRSVRKVTNEELRDWIKSEKL